MKPSPGTVSGRVFDARGRPLAGARVGFVGAPGPVPDTAQLTGTDGRFSLAAPHAGRYEVAAHADGPGTATATVEVGPAGAVVTLQFGRP